MDEGLVAWVLDEGALSRLVSTLASDHDRLIGPTILDGAISYEEIESIDDLPRGQGSTQGPGRYRLVDDESVGWFGAGPPAQSLKRWIEPPRELIASARRTADEWSIDPAHPPEQPATAIIGARACDLAGRAVLRRVLDAADATRHDADVAAEPFVVAAACTSATESCFCASVGTGPAPEAGFDIVLTELTDDGDRLLAEAATPRGQALLRELRATAATDDDRVAGREAVGRVAGAQIRALDPTGLPGALRAASSSPAWSSVAQRCLACGNCTSVCPTCFCSNVEDATDPAGDVAERWKVWDSCFTLSFTEMHGGSVRVSTESRYRQWLTHKLDTWFDQFDESGCVGCGRCITWCPVGIDIVVEAHAVRADPGGTAVALTGGDR